MRRAITLPPAAYGAIEFLSDTLDWLNPWHAFEAHDGDEFDENFQQAQQQHQIHPYL